jgi:hypothetical protein
MLPLDEGELLTPRPDSFTLGKTSYPLYTRMGRSQGLSGRVREISPIPAFDSRAVQPLKSRYTDYDIPKLILENLDSFF